MMSAQSFREMQVARRGYSKVFMMVELTEYHASVGLIRLVRTASAHFLALAFKEATSSCILPSGRDQIPRVSQAVDTGRRSMTMGDPLLWRIRSPGESAGEAN
jgi:hypothetical protein